MVVCYWTATTTHVGEFASIPATNQTTTTHGSSMVRIDDGKFIEAGDQRDVDQLIETLQSSDPNEN